MSEVQVPKPSYLQPNSHKYKEEVKQKKKIEKVATGKTSVKKKPLGKRVSAAILSEDVQEVKSYLLWDVFIPALKDTIVDLIKKGADAVFYGGTTHPSNIKRSGNVSRASYAGYYNDNRRSSSNRRHVNKRAAHEFDDIIFEDRRDAEEVLSNMIEITMSYGMVSVADFYDLAGVESDFTDNKYGWGELSDARVVRSHEGYFLDLPKPEPID